MSQNAHEPLLFPLLPDDQVDIFGWAVPLDEPLWGLLDSPPQITSMSQNPEATNPEVYQLAEVPTSDEFHPRLQRFGEAA